MGRPWVNCSKFMGEVTEFGDIRGTFVHVIGSDCEVRNLQLPF